MPPFRVSTLLDSGNVLLQIVHGKIDGLGCLGMLFDQQGVVQLPRQRRCDHWRPGLTLSSLERRDTRVSEPGPVVGFQQRLEEPDVDDVARSVVTTGQRLSACVELLCDLIRHIQARKVEEVFLSRHSLRHDFGDVAHPQELRRFDGRRSLRSRVNGSTMHLR